MNTCLSESLALTRMCSALYLNVLEDFRAGSTPHGGRPRSSNALPNQFRCQTSKPSRLFLRTARSKALETCQSNSRRNWLSLSPVRRHFFKWHRTGNKKMRFGGADRDRTGDPLLAKQVLSQLSYSPTLADSVQPPATSCLLRAASRQPQPGGS